MPLFSVDFLPEWHHVPSANEVFYFFDGVFWSINERSVSYYSHCFNRSDTPWCGHFWVLHGGLPGLLFLAGIAWCDLYNMDFLIEDLLFDYTTGRWRHGDTWWANQLLHDGGRTLIKLTAAGAFICWVGSFFWVYWRPWRRRVAYILLVIGLCTGIVAVGQLISPLPCPYDLARYNGVLAHISLWDAYFSDQSFGHCFPGKHASGGFSLLMLYYLFRDRGMGLALLGLGVGLLAGSLFSVAQMARGAHFFSHNWWSMGIDWSVATLLYAISFRRQFQVAEQPVHGSLLHHP